MVYTRLDGRISARARKLAPQREIRESIGLEETPKKPQPTFVHPIEGAFARILDFYGVAWEYEPTTFPLAWDDKGNLMEAFTPDFYLPEQNLYIELTTLRPKLTLRKNRKLKKIQQLYPEVNIKLLKRRELRNMMLKFGMVEEAERILGTDAQEEWE